MVDILICFLFQTIKYISILDSVIFCSWNINNARIRIIFYPDTQQIFSLISFNTVILQV
jgi:hypothetical protein